MTQYISETQHFTLMKYTDARLHIFNIFKHKYTDHVELTKIINEIITKKVEMSSVRAYWSFQHKEFKHLVEERIEYIHKKIR